VHRSPQRKPFRVLALPSGSSYAHGTSPTTRAIGKNRGADEASVVEADNDNEDEDDNDDDDDDNDDDASTAAGGGAWQQWARRRARTAPRPRGTRCTAPEAGHGRRTARETFGVRRGVGCGVGCVVGCRACCGACCGAWCV